MIRANLIGWRKPSAVTENRSKSGQSIYVPKLILKKTIRTHAEILSQYKSVFNKWKGFTFGYKREDS